MQLQSEAIEKQRQEEVQLKEMEAGWLKEQQKMREEEEEFLKQEKLSKQKAAKKAREVSIKLKEEKEVKGLKLIIPSFLFNQVLCTAYADVAGNKLRLQTPLPSWELFINNICQWLRCCLFKCCIKNS